MQIKKHFRICIIIVLLFGLKNSRAQSKFTDDLSLGVNYHQGYGLPEYPVFIYILNDYFRAVDITLVKSSYGKNYWQQSYNYPQVGISFYHSTLGNNDILGKEYAFTAFTVIDLLKIKRFRLYNRTGIGMCYVTKKFDLEDNYLDVPVGSHINTHVNLRLGFGYLALNKIEFKTGVSFDHFSNANLSEPNMGVNALTFFAGANYSLGKKHDRITIEPEPLNREFYFDFYWDIGGKHTRRLTSQVFYNTSIAFEAYYKALRKLHLGIGYDFIYDSSIKPQFEEKERTYKTSDGFQNGLHISQSFIYNKFAVEFQEGIYLFLLEKIENHTFYTKGIFKYQISNRISLRIGMKSHLHILDYPEFGVAYRLK